jgi:hypothetical protein
MKVGDLVKIRHDSRTMGIVIGLGDNDTHEIDLLRGSPITYRVWVSWNFLDSDIKSMWNWQLDEIS